MKHGAAGYGVYFMILERLRDDAEYLSVKDYNMVAFDLRADAGLIKSVVEDFGLFTFTDDGECFYSESLKRRMDLMEEVAKARSEAGKKGAANRWRTQKKGENAKNIANAINNDGNAMANASKKMAIKLNKTNKTNKTREEVILTFDKFWALYPKKAGKQAALKKWNTLTPDLKTQNKMLNALDVQKKSDQWTKDNGQFIPNPATWLNQGRWEDDPSAYPKAGNTNRTLRKSKSDNVGNFQQRKYSEEDYSKFYVDIMKEKI